MDVARFMPLTKRTAAVLACGGESRRMGRNKLLIDLCGKSCIRRSAEALAACPDIEKIIVAAPRTLWDTYSRELAGISTPIVFSEAGATRSESVKNAAALADGDIILIHDGARPLVSAAEVNDSIEDAFRYGSSVVCTPLKDTVRFSDGEKSFCPSRENLFTVRTPQTFSVALYRAALENAPGDFTDDSQLIDALGITPHITEGSYRNIKLTTEDDIALARQYLGGNTLRIGHGYDVHRLAEGRDLILGGVKIDWNKGLLGHSDADVLVHAVMDSILGAASMGDIGKLFPDSDPAYSGADSLKLLEEVSSRIRAAGFDIENIDATVIAQAPKISPYIHKMTENISRAAGIAPECVSVKATTEEGLGFSGREEGVSAHAVCLLRKK